MAGVIRLCHDTSESVYVNFIRSNACSSNVGMYTTGNYVFVGDSAPWEVSFTKSVTLSVLARAEPRRS